MFLSDWMKAVSTLPSSSPVRRQPLVDQVLGHLQEQIAAGTYPVGSKLPPENELMAQLAVGRSTVREAMRVLAHMGLVDVRPGDGTYVRTPSAENESLGQRLQRARIFEVYEVRRSLELECVRLAALRRDENDLTLLRQTLQDRRALLLTGGRPFIEADLAFHVGIADATKNSVLADLYRAFINVHQESWLKASEVPGLNEQGQALHEQIADAIAAQDADRAERILKHMLDSSTARFQEVLQHENDL